MSNQLLAVNCQRNWLLHRIGVSSLGDLWKFDLRRQNVETLLFFIILTSVPMGGCVPEWTDSGGGPPYFLWPVVTSRV